MKNPINKLSLVYLSTTMVLALTSASASSTLRFDRISSNSSADVGDQLFVDVESDTTRVLFHVRNEGPLKSAIAGVYFEAGPLASIEQIVNGSGVSFLPGANPRKLPSRKNLSPSFTTAFSAGANPAPSKNGVNPGETLGVLFNLNNGQTYDDVINALNDGGMRIGFHVISLPDGESDAYVNNGSLPEPGEYLLLGTGILAMVGYGIRRRRQLTA